MEKNYYARELSGEFFESDMYYNENDAILDNLWIGGNRDFGTFNRELVANVINGLESVFSEIKVNRSLLHSSNPYHKNVARQIIEDYFEPSDKAERPKFTDDEINTLIKLAERYNDCSSKYELDIVCQALGVIYSKPFINGTFRGYSQSDWINYVCPESLKNHLEYIESVLFCKGAEFEITEEPIETADCFDNVEHIFDYVPDTYDTKKVKEQLAQNVRCKPENMKILQIAGAHTYTKYDYKEV